MGNTRRMKRLAEKKAYKEFVKTWKEVRERQEAFSHNGTRQSISNIKRERMAEKGEYILGRRPSFKEWLETVKRPSQFDATPEEVQEHIEDLTWDE